MPQKFKSDNSAINNTDFQVEKGKKRRFSVALYMPLQTVLMQSVIRSHFQPVLFILLCWVLFLGDSPTADIIVLFPPSSETTSYDQAKLLLVSASKETGSEMKVSTLWQREERFLIGTKAEKENFPKEFYKLFDSKMTLQSLSFTYKYYEGYSKPETLKYEHADTMTVKSLWKRKEFGDWVKALQTKQALEVILNLRGWRDSVYTAVYDDPVADNRMLYKLHVQLVPGENRIYFSSTGEKKSTAEFFTTYLNESKPTTDRSVLFHNSTLEESCTSCHEGLPSADSGATMNADCNVCHKEVVGASYVHSPVEMKECASCHSWSAEKKAVVLESGIPETCFACHDEQKNLVENAKVQHPVASECGTCHSPHGTEQRHQIKEKVYTLCLGCHENKKQNHPVGRHPMQYIRNEETGEEFSCVTCHNPHGSDNQKMMKFPGETLDVCAQCH
ncbi:MAG: cytochrome c3 family protein [Ignavibacteriae bacterium]|nr:cytochrome c3 family protein [Ignavibacteriota bacterium]